MCGGEGGGGLQKVLLGYVIDRVRHTALPRSSFCFRDTRGLIY